MKIFLVRHTKPAIPEGICYGQTDIDIKDSISLEREAIQKRLVNANISKTFSSPLIRCAKLARSFVPLYGPIVYDDRLMEFNFGDWEMKPWAEIEKEPTVKNWYKDYINTPVPGGESFTDLMERVRAFCLDIQSDPENQEILVICHGGVIRAFDIILNGTEPLRAFDPFIGFGSVTEISVNKLI